MPQTTAPPGRHRWRGRCRARSSTGHRSCARARSPPPPGRRPCSRRRAAEGLTAAVRPAESRLGQRRRQPWALRPPADLPDDRTWADVNLAAPPLGVAPLLVQVGEPLEHLGNCVVRLGHLVAYSGLSGRIARKEGPPLEPLSDGRQSTFWSALDIAIAWTPCLL